jgi:hypothetical protein
MNAKKVVHYSHGSFIHDVAIFIAERCVLDAGHQLMDDRRWFEDKHYHSGIPDVYFRVEVKRHSGPRVVRDVLYYCLEIETKPTSQSVWLKHKQFEESSLNHKVLIVDLSECEDTNDLEILKKHINKKIP